MSLRRFTIFSAFVGLLVPLVFGLLWGWINTSQAVGLDGQIIIHKITLALWPVSINMLAASNSAKLTNEFYLADGLVNVLLYTILGISIWYGIHKSRIILLVPISVIGVIWWGLFVALH